MFNPHKGELHSDMVRYKILVRIRAGFHYLKNDNRKQIVMTVFIVLVTLLWLFRGYIWNTPMCPPIGRFFGTLFSGAILVIGTATLLIAFSHPLEAEQVDKMLKRAGFVNAIGESPVLLYKKVLSEEEEKYLYVFSSKGIPMNEWNDKLELVENALNIIISEIRLKDSKHTIEVYAVDGNFAFPEKVYWKDEYLSENESDMLIGISPTGKVSYSLNVYPHTLIGGTTGSGKTILLKVLLYQCVKKNFKVFIADFKGGVDFNGIWNEHAAVMTETEEVIKCLSQMAEELKRRKELFRNTFSKNISDYNSQGKETLDRIVFACDEIAEMLDKSGLAKEEKQNIEKMERYLSLLARQGRAFGIHLLLATQRPDATILNGQIKNNVVNTNQQNNVEKIRWINCMKY